MGLLGCLVAVSWCVLVCSGNVLTVSLGVPSVLDRAITLFNLGYWMLGGYVVTNSNSVEQGVFGTSRRQSEYTL